MSLEAMTWAIRQEVGGNEKLVLILLANRLHPDQGCCWPKLDLVARDAGISYATVKRAVSALVASNLIVTSRTHKDGFLGGYRFYFCDDRISPEWKKYVALAQNEPTGKPLAQNEPLEGSKCAIGRAQNEPAKTVRRNSKRNTPLPPEGEMGGHAPSAIGEDVFEKFWAAYPEYRRTGHTLAMASFAKAMKRSHSFTAIMEGLERHIAIWPTSGDHELARFVPSPAAWLDRGAYQDASEAIRTTFHRKPATAASSKPSEDFKLTTKAAEFVPPPSKRKSRWDEDGADDIPADLPPLPLPAADQKAKKQKAAEQDALYAEYGTWMPIGAEDLTGADLANALEAELPSLSGPLHAVTVERIAMLRRAAKYAQDLQP